MSNYPDSTQEVKRSCEEGGITFQNLEKVRQRVYRGTLEKEALGGTKKVYVKLHPAEKESDFRKFTEIATDVGHPPCQLIKGDILYFVMAKAAGKPLSKLLPVVTVPIIWNFRQSQYVSAYRQIGKQLGRLHTETKDGKGPLFGESESHDALSRTRVLDGTLSDEKISKIQYLFERPESYKTVYAITYGDRTPHNLFFDGKVLTQIDCSCKWRSVAYDHRSVVLGVQLMAKRLPYARSSIGSTLETAYWNGYEETGPNESNTTAFKIRYINGCLKLLERYDSSPTRLEGRLTKWVDPPILYSEIGRTIEEITL